MQSGHLAPPASPVTCPSAVLRSMPGGRVLAVRRCHGNSASLQMGSDGAGLLFWNCSGMLGGRECLAMLLGPRFPRRWCYTVSFPEAAASVKTSPGLPEPCTVAEDTACAAL